jgi:hypothetical protein
MGRRFAQTRKMMPAGGCPLRLLLVTVSLPLHVGLLMGAGALTATHAAYQLKKLQDLGH